MLSKDQGHILALAEKGAYYYSDLSENEKDTYFSLYNMHSIMKEPDTGIMLLTSNGVVELRAYRDHVSNFTPRRSDSAMEQIPLLIDAARDAYESERCIPTGSSYLICDSNGIQIINSSGHSELWKTWTDALAGMRKLVQKQRDSKIKGCINDLSSTMINNGSIDKKLLREQAARLIKAIDDDKQG